MSFKQTLSAAIAVLVAFLLMLSPVNATPTTSEYGVVLNLSGKQRMLTQKMSKEVALIALDIDKENNVKNLEATATLFDTTLKGLKDGDSNLGLPPTENAKILKQLGRVEQIWAGFYQNIKAVVANQSVTNEQLTEIAKNNPDLLKQMNRAVRLYEKDAQKNGLKASPALATTINLSGKQRMLTQKMSKEFFLIALGHQADKNSANLVSTSSLFDQTLKGLLDGDEKLKLPGTTEPHIREQLNQVANLWGPFQQLMATGADSSQSAIAFNQIEQAAQLNLPLLKEMNAAVKMYEELTAQ